MKKSLVKSIIAIMFVGLIVTGFLRTNGFKELFILSGYLSQKDTSSEETEAKVTDMDEIEKNFTDQLLVKEDLIELNGRLAKLLNIRGFYSDMGLYVTSDNYIVSASDYTTTDYEFTQTAIFRDFLQENEINFLYVNKPTKYIDDALFEREFGLKTYSNQNMDTYLERLASIDVPYLDLRDNIKKENINVMDLFYRTDHHWTVPAGLWATRIIANELNERFGYQIDLSVYDESNFEFKTWKNCWLGEQGRKISKAYVGLDDFTLVTPSFDTRFYFKDHNDESPKRSFDDFIDYRVFHTDGDVYTNQSWHYSYEIHDCINPDVEDGKVLIIGDSYDFITQPMLALTVHEVDAIILRQYDSSFSIKDYILENGYDTVIIAYGQFTLGTHDQEGHEAYSMYYLDR